jgi:hypothetical protein
MVPGPFQPSLRPVGTAGNGRLRRIANNTHLKPSPETAQLKPTAGPFLMRDHNCGDGRYFLSGCEVTATVVGTGRPEGRIEITGNYWSR